VTTTDTCATSPSYLNRSVRGMTVSAGVNSHEIEVGPLVFGAFEGSCGALWVKRGKLHDDGLCQRLR